MLAIERKNAILERLQKEQRVLVAELSLEYGVTEETIRRHSSAHRMLQNKVESEQGETEKVLAEPQHNATKLLLGISNIAEGGDAE